MKKVLLLVAAIFLLPVSYAEEAVSVKPKEFPKNDCDYKTKTDECFVSGTNFMNQFCQIVYHAASTEHQAGIKDYGAFLGEVSSCAKDAESYMDPMYKAMLKRHKGKNAASAIKDFYAAQLAGLRGIMPEPSETKMNYKSRQASTQQSVREKKARMELEIK